MVGLVIVSHSAQLAAGVAELMRGMSGADVRIATAGGMDLPDTPLGTDANQILHAIHRVYSPEGVLVLVDLGSAILSTDVALEMLAPEERAHVMIAPAALVEGGIAAAVQARLGSSLEAVAAEARSALDAKLAQLGAAPLPTAASEPHTVDASSPIRTLRLVIKNPLGLHARPAARFVRTAAQFQGPLRVADVTTGRGPVNAASINAVTTLGVLQGHTIEISAGGKDAADALAALQALADENFGDAATPPERAPAKIVRESKPAAENEIIGLAASPGIALGPARVYHPMLPPIPTERAPDPEREWARLQQAITQVDKQLQTARAALNGRGQSDEAGIFEAHALMLRDEAMLEPARRAIYDAQQNAAAAFDAAAANIAAQYDALDDPYLRARAADVRAVARQVLQNLLGVAHTFAFEPGILVAPDLTPAETAGLDPHKIQAICAAFGGPTSHSAILARSLGIPAVVGLGEKILAVRDGEPLIVDGERGRVWLEPNEQLTQEYSRRREQARLAAVAARAQQAAPAVTRDGHRVEIAANIGSANDARRAVEFGAEAVGLFRTEFLFLERLTAPDEEEQYRAYRQVAEALKGRSLLIRNRDTGGDKPQPYVTMPPEANPFLGLRGVRLTLAQPELFKTQLRAIVRVAAEFPLRVMFPMVSTLGEFEQACALLQTAQGEVSERGAAVPVKIETGIMVEVPGAALAAAQFARVVDFFSIGTNDLTQYVFAAERGNPHVAGLADSTHPALLKLIAHVVDAAHARDKWVGVCGEMAGDARAIPLLVGLGVDELSMSPPLIPPAKEIVRRMDWAQLQLMAQHALETK